VHGAAQGAVWLRGAQQLMARDHIVERALEHREIHRAGDSERGNNQIPATERPAVGTLVRRTGSVRCPFMMKVGRC
jgi:hypothetical protein